MADVKKTLLKKKVAGAVVALYPETSADIVKYNETSTVAEEIAKLIEAVGGVDGSVSDQIAAAVEQAKKDLLGIDETHQSISEAYDTLREIAEWIESDTTGAAKIAADVASLTTKVTEIEDSLKESGTVGAKIKAVEDAINTTTTGIKDRLQGAEEAINELDEIVNGNSDDDAGLVGKVEDLETAVGTLARVQVVDSTFEESNMNGTDLYFVEIATAGADQEDDDDEDDEQDEKGEGNEEGSSDPNPESGV